MHNEIKLELQEKMEKTINSLLSGFHTIRAGRANPKLLDRITIEYYGAVTPLKQIAAISSPEPRMLQISPYDTTVMSAIEKAIMISDLGINPSNDGKVIRLMIPLLTEETRREIAKQIKKMGEDSKIAIRHERRHANDELKKLEKNNDITEDELKASEKEVQKLTDANILIIDKMVKDKEAEMMEV